MKRIHEYYKQLQYNVLQTAIENVPTKQLVTQNFNEQSNLCAQLMFELKELGYQITKIPK